jgi:deazaflavin-dependent oxidoreductase (nitroreductase family)
MAGMAEFNAEVVAEFRANGGRVGGRFADTTLILVHNTGARTGVERVSPVACSDRGDGRYAIIAANGGSPRHPGWYHNLRARQKTTVELGEETFPVHVTEVDGPAHAELWRELVEEFPHIAGFQARTARRIPLLILTRVD